MSNRLFQSIVHQMKDAIDRTIGVADKSGAVISCSELVRIGETIEGVREELTFTNEAFRLDGYTYHPLANHGKVEYVVFVEGNDETADNLATILCISLSNIKSLYDEKYDKSSFIKNVILDNILPGDIYIKSRELRFNNDASRVVFIIRVDEAADISSFDVIQNFFPDKTKDFVININETDIALVKEVRPNVESKDLEKLAQKEQE